MAFTIESTSTVTAHDVAAIKKLTAAATAYDDMAPLSEHVLIHLHHGGDSADEHVIMRAGDGTLVGYLHLDQTDIVAGPVVEVVVHPDFRRQGLGRRLVTAAVERARNPKLRLWAHGELASAYQLANDMGFTKTRELWQMRRSLLAPLPKVELADGVTLRTFVPGIDENAWLDLNAEVFAEHPEQGRMTREDLDIRMSEGWFEPRGFFLAAKQTANGEKLVGFHWTKIHGGLRKGAHDHPEIGEIYVLGIAPSERGTHLGRALTFAGLDYLRREGLSAAMLYVDAENESARHLYETLGFAHWDSDVMFTHS